MTEILWIQDQDSFGPINGLISYNSEELWFRRTEEKTDEFELHRLSEIIMNKVKENHINYCKKTGYPLKHGDPIIMRTHDIVEKSDTLLKGIPDEGLEVYFRSLGGVIGYAHSINTLNVKGELITVINEKDIINF